MVCGPKEKTRPMFLKAFEGFDTTPRMLRGIWKRVEDEVAACFTERPDTQGMAFRLDGDVYIVMPEWSRSVFIHEAYHAAHKVLKEISSDDEELGAYVIEWLTDAILGRDEPKRRKP